MESYRPCSGPLSAPAQRILSALRAQYRAGAAGRQPSRMRQETWNEVGEEGRQGRVQELRGCEMMSGPTALTRNSLLPPSGPCQLEPSETWGGQGRPRLTTQCSQPTEQGVSRSEVPRLETEWGKHWAQGPSGGKAWSLTCAVPSGWSTAMGKPVLPSQWALDHHAEWTGTKNQGVDTAWDGGEDVDSVMRVWAHDGRGPMADSECMSGPCDRNRFSKKDVVQGAPAVREEDKRRVALADAPASEEGAAASYRWKEAISQSDALTGRAVSQSVSPAVCQLDLDLSKQPCSPQLRAEVGGGSSEGQACKIDESLTACGAGYNPPLGTQTTFLSSAVRGPPQPNSRNAGIHRGFLKRKCVPSIPKKCVRWAPPPSQAAHRPDRQASLDASLGCGVLGVRREGRAVLGTEGAAHNPQGAPHLAAAAKGLRNGGSPRPGLDVQPEDSQAAHGSAGGAPSRETPLRPPLFLTSDSRVRHVCRLSEKERAQLLQEVSQVPALALTLVYQDGTTQLDPEPKSCPSVSGILVLLKREPAVALSDQGPGAGDGLIYLRLDQQQTDQNMDLFSRDLVLQVVTGTQQAVCYKAKELLRAALQHCGGRLSWKQVSRCCLLDPQIAAWLLDPGDSASSFPALMTKHGAALGLRLPLGKLCSVIASLSLLYSLMMHLRSSLQTRGLGELFSNLELSMVPVLAAMESHRIHVDKDALKRTSELLGERLKQLEQEAHQAAGQHFLVSSSVQLRQVLFEKLRLQERCEGRKLPRTVLTQQQSTSESVLLQLQDLHPLPKIILEYRQVHKVKSTFVDGILSCMNKTSVFCTWNQTSTVSGRLSAKRPNFQALPRLPVRIARKPDVEGDAAEMVTVQPRSMFLPQEGWTFLAADFCQVELRLLAHLSSDPELLRIFQDPSADVFAMLASQWNGLPVAHVSPRHREQAKRVVYSVVYGAGRGRLSRILGLSAEQAALFMDSFSQAYREVQRFIQRTVQQCQSQGYVLSLMGRQRVLPHIQSPDCALRKQAERQAVNFVVQGSAADLCKTAMIRIHSQLSSSPGLTARLIAQIHDELLFEVEDSQLMDFAVLVKTTMESLQHVECLGIHLKVPLKVAVTSGKSWGVMSELRLPAAPLHPAP
ncbi:DNA polymerase nu isoform X2 [Paramormyrops kingsleyae]|uniref:DNA polymerase nu isoform X2 n=1 Tax=Paramormyrops kingsleyae TaxID=1676925 RepID=UPI003B97CA93